MYLKHAMACSLGHSLNKKSLRKQQGNMIVMALFIIVVGGLLVASLIKALNASSASTIQQVYGLRAELAAQSGIQNALEFSFPNNGVAQACNQTINSPSSFANVEGLRLCSYSTVCTTEVINFQSISYNYYKFSSTGSCTIDNSVVSRTVSVDAITE
ncbi:type II secretory pathway component [Glaciecola petra]|uniref:Type II secretory pathway component n=1 Tax=Glaciecola petra TaxID=3075602 RepID=A0ABU2ZSR0_9ALTE|nr:type II secretory pathway component [Aestuariibacter sp. P117]MDT0595645.1 type II secretory pathway component [Aestuariibacter sp. P117]